MPGFVLENFGGAIPVMGKRLLAPNFAQRAVNVDLLSGEMRGIPLLTAIHTFAASPVYAKAVRLPQKLTVPGEKWMGLVSKHGAVLPYAVSNDAFLRFTIIDNNSPGNPVALRYNTQQRIYDDDDSYLLGVPQPSAAPSLIVSGGSGDTETRSYVYTFVDAYGQEGPPSDPVVVTGFINGSWNLSVMDTTVPDSAERPTFTKRIYRTVFANSGISTFRKVADTTLAASTYNDTIANTVVASNVQLEATSWFAPETMEGVVAAPGGFLAGWSGRTLFFSEPYRPWAWPPEYAIAVEHDILGCAYIDQTLVVVTESSPVFISGSVPSSLSVARTDVVEAGVSSPSIVGAADGVYFATRAGLMRASAAGLQNVTEKLISEHDWSENFGENILSAARYQTKYIGMTSAGMGFMLDWRDTRVAYTELSAQTPFSVIWVDDYTGQLHAMASNVVYQWGDQDAGRHNLLWRSKEFVFPQPMNLACALVEMDVGPDTSKEWGLQLTDDAGFAQDDAPAGGEPTANGVVGGWTLGDNFINQAGTANTPEVDFEDSLELPTNVDAWMILYANGRRIWQGPVYNNRLVRLPAGYKSTAYEISIVSALTIYSIRLATSPKELSRA